MSGLSVHRPELHEATALGAARLAGSIVAMAAPPEMSFMPASNVALQRRQANWQEAMHAALKD
ncbi:MAG TPA: hypothetical protein VGO35_10995 [Gammaproteobacteria bacterium]|nr:hypothetical protein [Gammaproteobacteria bacterium]